MSLRIDDTFPSKYLKALDLKGKEHTCTIDNITIEQLGDDTKPVVAFKGRDKMWVMNKTNALQIAGSYGQDMADWFDKDVILFSMKVQGPNGLVDGIRCRVPADAAAKRYERTAAAEPRNNGPDFDDEIPF